MDKKHDIAICPSEEQYLLFPFLALLVPFTLGLIYYRSCYLQLELTLGTLVPICFENLDLRFLFHFLDFSCILSLVAFLEPFYSDCYRNCSLNLIMEESAFTFVNFCRVTVLPPNLFAGITEPSF